MAVKSRAWGFARLDGYSPRSLRNATGTKQTPAASKRTRAGLPDQTNPETGLAPSSAIAAGQPLPLTSSGRRIDWAVSQD